MRHIIAPVLLGLAVLAWAAPTPAQTVLSRVRERGAVQCGAAPLPGFAAVDGAGNLRGLAVDLCRAAAIGVLGPDARIDFRLYESARDYDPVRRGEDDIAFLSDNEIAAETLAASVVPGPPAYIEPVTLMVPVQSAVQRLENLQGQTVCLMAGGVGQRALEAALAARHVTVVRLVFQEANEMLDGYDVQRCQAMADTATTLATFAQEGGVRDLKSRLLPDPLALLRILATTATGDGQWAALAFWLLGALEAADEPGSQWQGRLDLPDAALGLDPGWRAAVLAKLGSYAAMYRRNLGDGSPLGLAIGPNAPWPAGLLLPPAPR